MKTTEQLRAELGRVKLSPPKSRTNSAILEDESGDLVEGSGEDEEVNAADATPQKAPASDDLSKTVLESLTGVSREWLSPVRPFFDRLAALAMSDKVTDADFITALEASQKQLPELFDRMNTETLQTALMDAMGTAALNGSIAPRP